MPSYNYQCKDCKTEVIFTIGVMDSLPSTELYCAACESSRLELLEFSDSEDLQAKKIISEIQSLHERIEKLAAQVDEVRKRIEVLEDFSSSDFSGFDDTLVN